MILPAAVSAAGILAVLPAFSVQPANASDSAITPKIVFFIADLEV